MAGTATPKRPLGPPVESQTNRRPSTREVCLVGVPARKAVVGKRVSWAGRAYRVTSAQRPIAGLAYLHLTPIDGDQGAVRKRIDG